MAEVERQRKNSAAKIRANNRYNQKAYDYINAAVPKGNKLKIKEHAAAMGESVNAFINRAIDEAMKRDKSINELNVPAAPSVEANPIKSLVAEPEQTASPLPEPKPEEHYKSFTEDIESTIDLQKLLTDVNYQLDIMEDYGTEVLAKLLEKARQQADTNEQEAEAQQDTN